MRMCLTIASTRTLNCAALRWAPVTLAVRPLMRAIVRFFGIFAVAVSLAGCGLPLKPGISRSISGRVQPNKALQPTVPLRVTSAEFGR